jgi:2-oxoisovalerate dehydrogenase E2 component (dihydrolipoyl transacylase)
MKVFNLPDLGEGLQEAAIVEWHVKPGDTLAADQAMVSVETDKAIVEIPAPHEGTVEKLFGEPGERIRVGAPLVSFTGAAPDSGTVVGEIVTEVKATPAIRALARSLNVALATVRGSGPGGVVTSEDVKKAARGSVPHPPARASLGMRTAMARNMTLAHREVAAVTLMDDADVEHWPERTPVLARLVRALIAGCRAEPGMNAWYDARAEMRQLREEIDLGIAVDLPDGLIVPVLRDAHRLGAELEEKLAELLRQARSRSLPPDRLRGATITLSNFGPLGGRYASPIVVPPSVAILGAGRISRHPVVDRSGAVAAHRVLPLSLTFDHRALTGGEAARFLAAVLSDLDR